MQPDLSAQHPIQHPVQRPRVRDLLAQSSELADISDTASLDCQLLLGHVLSAPRSWLYAHAEDVVDEASAHHFLHLLMRRRAGEPIAYLTGTQDFWDMSLKVDSATLIPRPETETLVEAVLNDFDRMPRACIDLGTGSGAIALALARERPDWQMFALERNESALSVAAENVVANAAGKISLIRGSWMACVAAGTFDIVVANPPYIAPNDEHLADLGFEPAEALVSAEAGLCDIRLIAADAFRCLRTDGALYLEHGHDQQHAVATLLGRAGYSSVTLHRDLAGRPRVTSGRRAA